MTSTADLLRGGTLPDPSRTNDGRRVAAVAALMHLPLLPWQRYVADVATEIDPDTGTYMYDTVIVSTPRQCGKSALVDVTDVYNASLGPRRRIVYSAQTGKDSEDHFKELRETLSKSRLSQKIKSFRLSNGNMNATFVNGSTLTPMAMTKVAGHGKQMDKITIDEAFSLSREAGDTIMDAIIPTMNTRMKHTGVRAQRWITSTEGTADSTWFNALLDSLRAGDVPSRTCWFDFGVPLDADPNDLDTIMRYHPAAGRLWYKTQLADFRATFEGNDAGWARAFGNVRDTGVGDRLISADAWTATSRGDIDPTDIQGRPVCFGVAVDIDDTMTSIAVATLADDDRVAVQLIDTMPGVGDAPDRVMQLARRHRAPVCIDRGGPNAPLHDRLAQTAEDDPDLVLVRLTGGDYLAVGQSFVNAIQAGTLTHTVDPDLDDSAATCTRAWNGDAWRVTRRGSAGRTSPLEACMMAYWGVTHMPTCAALQIY